MFIFVQIAIDLGFRNRINTGYKNTVYIYVYIFKKIIINLRVEGFVTLSDLPATAVKHSILLGSMLMRGISSCSFLIQTEVSTSVKGMSEDVKLLKMGRIGK